MLYKTTNYYSSANEVCIRWDDPDLSIEWPKLEQPYVLSEKDAKGVSLGQAAPF